MMIHGWVGLANPPGFDSAISSRGVFFQKEIDFSKKTRENVHYLQKCLPEKMCPWRPFAISPVPCSGSILWPKTAVFFGFFLVRKWNILLELFGNEAVTVQGEHTTGATGATGFPNHF